MDTETQAKHTPGPWACRTSDGIITAVEGPDGKAIAIMTSSWVIRGKTRGNLLLADANARLIAAAPDLLVALKELYEACCRADIAEELSEMVDGSLLDAANEAIAKAEGR